MPSEYISKRSQVIDYIEQIFFPIDGSEGQYAVPRADLNLLLMRKLKVDPNLITSVLTTYEEAGLLIVTPKKVELREKKKEVEEKPESE